MRLMAMRALTALELWLCASFVFAAGCGVYDPSLIQGRSEYPQSFAGGSANNGTRIQTGSGSTRCETGQTSCSLPNAQAVCVKGQCTVVSCTAPFADCDNDAANGCEADLTSVEHCGLCNSVCRFSHAEGTCATGRCTLGDCENSYDNCDDDPSNGCEQKVDSLSDCGACGQRCERPRHATAACLDGACGIGRCDTGYGDCNEDTADGCEQVLNAQPHCGSCGENCVLPHTKVSACENALCVVRECEDGFEDCNGDAADGCEADLAQANNCGGCGRDCDLPNTEATRCNVMQSSAQCQVDHGACGGDVSQEDCSGRLSSGCAPGHADCDANPANGCETDLSRLSSCGSCDNSCVEAHAVTACRDGQCVRMRCDPGYGACDASGACMSLLDDVNNCGRCGNVCSGTTPRCAGAQCTGQTCEALRADCDGSDGCEQALTTREHCGGCGRRCEDAPHATMTCETGACAIARCDDGFADCDKEPRNGCEVDLSTTNDCGGCGNVCAFAHSGARCNAGSCERASCDPGYGDCNADNRDGCETSLLLPDNCGACGNTCRALPNVVGSTCEASGCVVQCQQGRGNCDGDNANGCEASLTAADSCGSCGLDCTALPNTITAECRDGGCRGIECTPGFADCNGIAADGCERALNTLSDCGACDKPCAMAHAAGDCSDQTCRTGMCDEGFADCDTDPQNGCETALNDAAHCGTCNNACAGETSCVNGACGCNNDEQCGPGQGCCDGRCVGNAGSCFPWPCIPGTDLNKNALHCGGCGNLCLGWCCGGLL